MCVFWAYTYRGAGRGERGGGEGAGRHYRQRQDANEINKINKFASTHLIRLEICQRCGDNTHKKSRIRETSNLSTDADCSTNTIRGLGSDDVTRVGTIVS